MRQVLKIPMPITSLYEVDVKSPFVLTTLYVVSVKRLFTLKLSYEMSAKSSFATYVFIIYPYRIWRISLLQGHLLLLHRL